MPFIEAPGLGRVHIHLSGGPEHAIRDRTGKVWVFEDDPNNGPMVLTKAGAHAKTQPAERSPFWEAYGRWSEGQRDSEKDSFDIEAWMRKLETETNKARSAVEPYTGIPHRATVPHGYEECPTGRVALDLHEAGIEVWHRNVTNPDGSVAWRGIVPCWAREVHALLELDGTLRGVRRRVYRLCAANPALPDAIMSTWNLAGHRSAMQFVYEALDQP